MNRRAVFSILLITVGVGMIVIGTLTVLGGVGKVEAAQEWEANPPIVQTCSYNTDLPPGASPEEHMEEHRERCGGRRDFENPFAGGELDILKGLIIALIGGVVVYVGTQN